MKKLISTLVLIGLLYSLFYSNNFSDHHPTKVALSTNSPPEDDLKQAAFDVLNTKCNTCHKKQNPFKIFSLKNMEKHAIKIYQQVFVLARMPKGNQIKLTEEEYASLKKWLQSQNI